MAVGDPRIDHATPLYQQKLALTSPTSGCRSVGIVRLRTKATELVSYHGITVWSSIMFHKVSSSVLLNKYRGNALK
jgi:hypothetical protein